MGKDSDAKASLLLSELETKKSAVPMPVREYPKCNCNKTSADAVNMTASNMQLLEVGDGPGLPRTRRRSKFLLLVLLLLKRNPKLLK